MKNYNLFLASTFAIIAMVGCSKNMQTNNTFGSNLKKAVFTRSATDSVVTSFSYDSNGNVISIIENGSNMVGFSESTSSNVIITFQRNASGKVLSYGIHYPKIEPVLVLSNDRTPFYIANTNKLAYSIGGIDSSVYNYTGSYITSSIIYSRMNAQILAKRMFAYDAQGNLTHEQLYKTDFTSGNNLLLVEDENVSSYDNNINAFQTLTHEEAILALRPKYASPNNVISENYQYSIIGNIAYSYTYNNGLPTMANASSTSSIYTGTVRFYY